METVLRETGVGDLSIPKTMRGLAARSASLLQSYEQALAQGQDALGQAIANALPLNGSSAEAAAVRLASYLKGAIRQLEAQPLSAFSAGVPRFPKIAERPGQGLGE
jgi:cytochrome b pre-mRNA-processing protein 3